ncbi:MAG: OmpA family protein [Alphaproteobacteria bacterium]|nr:MAG: OmpA family protein [Alphaproteobacteria bacterium]
MRSCGAQNAAMSEQEAAAFNAGPSLPIDANGDAGGAQAGGTTNAAVVPAGAGVVSESRANRPLLRVYFDSGKAAVSNDLATASTKLKTYLDANPGARLAVSGYNDPSGNAAANAELSKTRAQAVAAALAQAGISPNSIDLVKPNETTSASITPEQARRVEVSVR